MLGYRKFIHYFQKKYNIDLKVLFKKTPSGIELIKMNIFKKTIELIINEKKKNMPIIKPKIENE